MKEFQSFLQTVFQLVKSLFTGVTKQMHRNAVVLTVGVSVVTVITFTAGNFHGGGHNALVAFAETQSEQEDEDEDLKENTAAPELDILTISSEDESLTGSVFRTSKEAVSDNRMKLPTAETVVPETEEETEVFEETEEEIIDLEETEAETEPEPEPEPETEAETESAVPVISCTEKEYRELLKIVQAEAGSCDLKGKILVANVIMNRVHSNEFPNSIVKVIYQSGQFSPVSDGSINRVKISDETIEAVNRALAGEDPSQGALYFMNRRASAGRNVRWFDSHLEFLFQHEKHEFFR